MFCIELPENGHQRWRTFLGNIRRNFIRIPAGRPCAAEPNVNDLTRGRIMYRYK